MQPPLSVLRFVSLPEVPGIRRRRSALAGVQVYPATAPGRIAFHQAGEFLQVDRQRTQERDGATDRGVKLIRQYLIAFPTLRVQRRQIVVTPGTGHARTHAGRPAIRSAVVIIIVQPPVMPIHPTDDPKACAPCSKAFGRGRRAVASRR